MSEKEEFPDFTEEFKSSIIDFVCDLKNTFPEYANILEKWSKETENSEFQNLFEYCLKIYPERFFDILNQNKSLFSDESTLNVEFLPGLDFKKLFNTNGVTDKIQETIWKYLQVILLILVNSLQSKINFGEAMNVFNEINIDELQSQITDAMKNISSFFEDMNIDDKSSEKEESNETTESEASENPSTDSLPKLPKIEELKDHLQFLFDGKIGKLAKELADDMSNDFAEAFGGDLGEGASTKDVLNAFMKNPQKMGNVVNTVKEKLADKMKSGDITKEDLVNEASEMMSKMQGVGESLGGMEGMAGMAGMGDMFKKMAKSMGLNVPKGAKMNTNAFNEMQKKSTAKERLKARAMAKKQAEVVKKLEEEVEKLKRQQEYEKFLRENPEFNPESPLFSLDEKQEKSALRDPNVPTSSQKKRAKKKVRKEKTKEKKETKVEST